MQRFLEAMGARTPAPGCIGGTFMPPRYWTRGSTGLCCGFGCLCEVAQFKTRVYGPTAGRALGGVIRFGRADGVLRRYGRFSCSVGGMQMLAGTCTSQTETQ